MKPLDVCFLTVMPSPYTADMFAAMAKDGRIAPQVFYLEHAAPDTHWHASQLPAYAQVLPGSWFYLLGGRLHVNPGAVARLKQVQADLFVVAGYAGITNQAVMRWLHRSGKPWIFWGEVPGMRRGGVRNTLRWLAQRPAVRWPQGIAAIGSLAASAYRRLVNEHCLVENIPYHCDLTEFFALHDPTAGAVAAPDGPVNFLYCGQLIERKGVDLLVAAFSRVAQRHSHITLTLVGDGPLRETLSAAVPAALKDRVHFAGFKQIGELAVEFGLADVFVLPSRHDGWGVVVNQALAAGLPVICSDAVGAAADLVQPEANGLLVPAGDEEPLATAIERLASDAALRATMGQRSRTLAADYTPERGVDRWWQLCSQLVSDPSLCAASK